MPDNILNWEDKINSPELLAYLEHFGNKTYLSAEEINELRDSVNYLNNKPPNRTNGLVSLGELIRVGNDTKFPAEVAEWVYNNVTIKNHFEFTAVTPVASNGKYRTDLVVGDAFGALIRVPGTEGDRVAVLPNIPPETVIIKQINVFGAAIDTSSPPVTGEPYVRKEFYSEIFFSLSGDVDAYPIGAQFGHYIFKDTGAMTSFSSINLFNSAIHSYVGKWLILENRQATAIPIRHNSGTGTSKFIMPGAVDYYLQPGEKIITTFTRELTSSGSFKFLVSSNKGASIVYVDEKVLAARTTPQFNIYGNTPLTNAHNGAILKIKASCIITVQAGLIENFSCVTRTFAGATATWVEGTGITFDAPKGKIQDPLKMATFFKDENSNTGILTGETRP